jgi:hypothetical protein
MTRVRGKEAGRKHCAATRTVTQSNEQQRSELPPPPGWHKQRVAQYLTIFPLPLRPPGWLSFSFVLFFCALAPVAATGSFFGHCWFLGLRQKGREGSRRGGSVQECSWLLLCLPLSLPLRSCTGRGAVCLPVEPPQNAAEAACRGREKERRRGTNAIQLVRRNRHHPSAPYFPQYSWPPLTLGSELSGLDPLSKRRG